MGDDGSSTGGARHHETDARTVTRLRGTVDPWFLGRYGMNLYRGCEHGCLYCDGRAERYYVQGDFARDIAVKRNAVDVLDRELGRAREPGFVFIGGGVSDGYQPAERRYELARGVLHVAAAYRLPVHVLTKSSLVERDLELLADIAAESGAILSFSIQTLDDCIRERFEPGACRIVDRLRLMARAKALGIAVGAMALPVLPGISDQPEQVASLVAALADHGADFVCFGGLTLRPGIQRATYLSAVAAHRPELVGGYERVYRVPRRSGAPDPRYLSRVDERFRSALGRVALPSRPPHRLFRGKIPRYAELGVRLEHREAARIDPETGRSTVGLGLGRAGYAIQAWAAERLGRLARRKGFHYSVVEQELEAMIRDGSLTSIEGVGAAALDFARREMAAAAP